MSAATSRTADAPAAGTAPAPMRAVIARPNTALTALEVHAVPRPTVIPGEVLIRVSAAGVNPVDVKSRIGRGAATFLTPHPQLDPNSWIPGWDVAGDVIEIGRGVAKFKPGDRVFGMVNFPRSAGAYAEYVCAPVAHICHTPSRLSDVEAAGLPMAAMTAWQALIHAGRLTSGQRVLVTAASGGVGHLAVQIARDRGAQVVALTSTENVDFVRSLGAESVDRSQAHWQNSIHPVDLVLDMFGGDHLDSLYTVIRPGGALITVSSASLSGAPPDIRTQMVVVSTDGQCLHDVADAVHRGAVTPHVSRVFTLEDAGRAHEAISHGRTRGKLVIDTSGRSLTG
ncbi:NADPH:quinone reductase [Mycolicibacterium parafortuitum]|uniref:NADPH:quinone reductase n=1 Tax=Mycolicibacterium parafortuitum TaxID=39692 RepID=A0A7I7TXM8_MYCPF|nr:NADP-dependent oxidoreductase [Mycolicibacterium parafortuitum]BBY73199.1 NADPH:quinone reductase [Mycolicibacterium parafortuitum]